MARPKIYDPDVLAEKLNQYIIETDEPFIQEFCLNEDLSADTLYRLEKGNTELSEAIKKALRKQELYMLKNAETGKVNPVFAIFRLKQKCFGYTDKAELDIVAKQEQYDSRQLKAQLMELLDDLSPEERLQLTSGNIVESE